MSEPYTPTTEDIRAAYENRAVIGPPAMAADYEEAEAQFYRWLATVKAETTSEWPQYVPLAPCDHENVSEFSAATKVRVFRSCDDCGADLSNDPHEGEDRALGIGEDVTE